MPQQRLILNLLRSVHILSLSILLGGLYFEQPAEFLWPWTLGVIISGLGMFAIDLYASAIALFELRGLTILVKILLLLLIPLTTGHLQLGILFTMVVISSIMSHSTRKVRHHNIMPISFQTKFTPQAYNSNPAKRLSITRL